MSNKRLKSFLSMSIIFGFIIDFFFTLILGTREKEIYNYLVSGICAVIPCIIFILFINIELKKYGRLNIKKNIIFGIIFLIISFIVSFFIEMLIVDMLFKKDINNIVRIVNALYQSTLGVIVSTNFNYDYFNFIKNVNDK